MRVIYKMLINKHAVRKDNFVLRKDKTAVRLQPIQKHPARYSRSITSLLFELYSRQKFLILHMSLCQH